ncbi:divalent metal cation transporter [Thiohalocapsa marina]|uniref:Divalent metal cation transporter n=1 Tax=Thiohalocapsa marina TaxID=424902 RepID=A0A5M8FVI6_9GAMM|nr:divalent metal cation transporter [Thiohalocapsa marina]KAA6187773.1 divalent metal cation transporter [Thiohalocapsa marina]
MPTEHHFSRALGPGLFFAAAAVGVSHLVQSTRAGADYGLALGLFILLALLFKYPAFRFGPNYTAATGTSLLEGYRRQGRWALVLYGVLTLGTMFTVQAAVTVVTAGLANVTLGLPFDAITTSALLLGVCAAVLAVGQFHWLDRIVKLLVVVFTVSTVIATLLIVPTIPWSEMHWMLPAEAVDQKTILFLAALVGWMPSAIDIAVWNSLWTLEKARDTGYRPSVRESMLDFHIGYIGTGVLAFCFMLLGAGVMYTSETEIATSAGAFATQVLDLYRQALGDWVAPIIGASALAVMFSTTLTVLDAFPRAIATLVERFRGEERPADERERHERTLIYWGAVAVLALGAVIVLHFLLSSLSAMVDIATTLSFLTAPVLAILNHRAMFQSSVPLADRPRPWLVVMSLAGIVALSGFALYYLYLVVLG